MDTDKIRKIVGGIAMVGGLILTFTNNWLQEQEIKKKVSEAIEAIENK